MDGADQFMFWALLFLLGIMAAATVVALVVG